MLGGVVLMLFKGGFVVLMVVIVKFGFSVVFVFIFVFEIGDKVGFFIFLFYY